MNSQEILALYDQQQRIEIEYPGTCKEGLPGIVRFTRPAPGENFILYSHLDENNVDDEIQKQITYFSQLGQPFEWDVYDHDTSADLLARLVASGFQPDEPGAVMVLDLQDAPPTLLEPVKADVHQITNSDQLDDVMRVEEQVWERNFDWLKSAWEVTSKYPEISISFPRLFRCHNSPGVCSRCCARSCGKTPLPRSVEDTSTKHISPMKKAI
jgi:hypothetical protein